MSSPGVRHGVLHGLAELADPARHPADHAQLTRAASLVVDHLACVAGNPAPGASHPGASHSAIRQASERVPSVFDAVSDLALAGHHGDVDDVHWGTATHPGSIIWPVVLGIWRTGELAGADAFAAASAGYRVTTTIAQRLAAAGVGGWHLTSIAGQAGAAVAAGVAYGLDPSDVAECAAIALTTAGGIGQTAAEGSTAGGFHRASAALSGVAAVHAWRLGQRAPAGVADGPVGLMALLGATPTDDVNAAPDDHDEPTRAWWVTAWWASVRPYPNVNGFGQAAVHAAAALHHRRGGSRPAELIVELHPAAAARCQSSPRWDITEAVANAWVTGDPWHAGGVRQDHAMPVQVVAGDVSLGAATVRLEPGDGVGPVHVPADFALTGPDSTVALEKWRRLGVPDPDAQVTSYEQWFATADA